MQWTTSRNARPQVQVLRAISRYLQQLGSTYSQPYIAQTIVANDELARGLVELFETRFDPASGLSIGHPKATAVLAD